MLQCHYRSIIHCLLVSCGLQARLRQDGDVMPTLDMALFDWTDYEDLKPEMWPSAKKKGAKLTLLSSPSSFLKVIL